VPSVVHLFPPKSPSGKKSGESGFFSLCVVLPPPVDEISGNPPPTGEGDDLPYPFYYLSPLVVETP